jgi:hypothetical protein
MLQVEKNSLQVVGCWLRTGRTEMHNLSHIHSSLHDSFEVAELNEANRRSRRPQHPSLLLWTTMRS